MADARLKNAEALLRDGHAGQARSALTAILASAGATPDDRRVALVLRAQACEALGDIARGDRRHRTAIARHPRDRAACAIRSASCSADSGDVQGAIDALTIAVELDPAIARAWNNLGNALRAGGRVGEAARRSAARWRRSPTTRSRGPISASLLPILATMPARTRHSGARSRSSRTCASMQGARRASRASAATSTTPSHLYHACAARPHPTTPTPCCKLAGALAERDDLEAARSVLRSMRAAHQPDLLRAAFGEALTLPMVYRRRGGRRRGARVYAAGPRAARIGGFGARSRPRLRGRDRRLALDELPARLPGRGRSRTADALCRDHGPCHRRGRAGVADVPAARPYAARASASASRRRSSRTGPAAATFGAGSPSLDRTRFEIFVYNLRRDATPFLQRTCSARRTTSARFPGAALIPSAIAPAIRADALDVLVYPELGMNAPTFALAALRLAPVQCAAWGHPVTTGHATIDTFFTCAAMEPSDGRRALQRALVALPGIGTDYRRPAMPDGATRARLGLPEDVPLFLCPQSLFKIHPDNDAAVRARARRGAGARLVIFEGRHPALTAKFRTRVESAFAREGLRARPAPDRAAAVRPRRLPADQRGLRRDARHAALVRRQHEPRCARRWPADRHAARSLHARAAERRHAGACRARRSRRARRRRLRANRGATRPRAAISVRAGKPHA